MIQKGCLFISDLLVFDAVRSIVEQSFIYSVDTYTLQKEITCCNSSANNDK